MICIKKLKLLFFSIVLCCSGFTYAQVFSFLSCGATGQDGPTEGEILSVYSGTLLEDEVTVIDGVQYWTVPATGTYRIEAFGGQGGNDGGLGARMYGEFELTEGVELKLIVGQAGLSNDYLHGSGGGASFVVFAEDNSPLIIAGGGGGRGKGMPGITPDSDGSVSPAGQFAGVTPGGVFGGGGAAGASYVGGTAEMPGGDSPSATWASGGGGLLTNGGGCSAGTVPGGRAFVNGGRGGDPASISNSPGGFGGGGGCGDRGGGGGGYSGGAAATTDDLGGGGGGSFNLGINQENQSGINEGDGSVMIIPVCSPITIIAPVTTFCFGEALILTANTPSGGAVLWSDDSIEDGIEFIPEVGITAYTASSAYITDCPSTVEIEVHALPMVDLEVDKDNICIGEGVVFSTGGTDSYVLNPTDVILGEIYYPEVGVFECSIIGADLETGCQNEDTIEVQINENPIVTAIVSDAEICFGESIILTGDGALTYDWMLTGIEDNESFVPSTTGLNIYTVEGTDINGCKKTAAVEVNVYETLQAFEVISDAIGGADGAINLTVTGGKPIYSFDWDTDEVADYDDTEDLTGLAGGIYTVSILDEAGCEFNQSYTVNSQLGIENWSQNIQVYPNPTIDFVKIVVEGEFSYQITNEIGSVLHNGAGFNQVQISMAPFTKGTYFLQLFIADKKSVVKLLKQ